MDNGELLHTVMRKNKKSVHMLVVTQALTKYFLQQGHDAFGHNSTART